MKKQSFIQGTLILLAAGIINRMLGFIPRIALPRIIGAEGVGLYQLAYPFFLVLVTVITGGIPLAIAKMVAEAEGENRPEKSRLILRTGLALSVGLAIFFTLVAMISASWVSNVILTDHRVYYTFIAMIPMIGIVAVSAIYRGYFQGKQNMIPSALSSIFESLVRIFFMLWFSWLLLPKGIAMAAAGAMLGVTVGEIGGMLAILWQYYVITKKDKKQTNPTPEQPVLESEVIPSDPDGVKANIPILRRLLGISIPVTASRLVGSFSYLLESIITVRSLALAGIATSAATAQYGSLQGMVIPLLLLPGALTSSLAVSLVPSISEAAARKDLPTIHKRMHQALRLALVTGAPFAVLMYILAVPLCNLLYGNADTAPMLKLMAPFALFIYVQAPLQATLQAMDRPGRALINTLIGAVVKIILIVILASQPEYGIYGAIIAIIVNSILVTLLHGYSVVSLISLSLRVTETVKTLCAMLIMGAGVHYVYTSIPIADVQWIQFLFASAIGMVLYFGISLLAGLISLRDLDRLPFIKRRL
ncbi:stage V sporulation protein B [Paenibacillus odorifer]|uniref:stage V sporulation protein B n=1 Tax=Paenibacillus TaxID=44249 RepID=UPI00096F4422|nr:stage V sporulation protein B [Paenibacillus odorifer]OME21091.1 stage V sporulation protein B [Paenibacillus odorifer]OME29138.1 stage V sporulation protein B [Paenibacillus odorifer]OME38580.1 stage V sporulation protein B [Paenibacillus odorifer]